MSKILAWENGTLKEFKKLEVHEKGLLHPAISVFILCGDQLLLQRRALQKYHTPGLWTNSCCSHPFPGESTRSCSERRLVEELGIKDVELKFHSTIRYRADVGNQLIENEVVDVFFGLVQKKTSIDFDLNPDEVMEVQWVSEKKLLNDIVLKPENFTPWLKIYLEEYSILSQMAKTETS